MAPASSAPPRASFDPPTRFGPTPIALGPGRASDVLLYAGIAFVAADTGTTVTDLLSGEQITTLNPTAQVITRPSITGTRSGHTPVLVQRDGRPGVVIPYAVRIAATGSTAASQAVQLLIADAATGQQPSALNVAATPAENGGDFTGMSGEYVTVVGAQGNTLVLTVGRQVTVGVDLTTGSVLWRNTALTAAAVLGDTVVGLTTPDDSLRQRVVGLGVADGVQRWTAASGRYAQLAGAGPAYVVLVAEQDDGKRFYARIDGAGKVFDRRAGAYSTGIGCLYDQAAITVCTIGTLSADLVFAFDATDGSLLWQLPATGRPAPAVTAVWHGAVYGTSDTRPVVLDTDTGVDRETDPGLAPDAVSAYAGVTADLTDPTTMTAYPATG